MQTKQPSLFQKYWHILALIGILIFSFFLNFYAIGQNGYGNEYYAAAIRSMTQSFHNFFFVSFDPAGMVSVDKPPLGLWMQALSCLIFGYHGWAMLLPQALSGTASSLMMYILVKRHFGKGTGLLAALAFAVVPAVVVVSRNNTIDMQLIFVLLIATYFLMKAIETDRLRYLLLTGLFIGLGFNIKMFQAFTIIPAIALTYVFFSKKKIWKRIMSGIAALAVALVVSSAWVVAVELTPADSRPYVDSTSGNSMIELIFDHNGTERLVGGMGGGGRRTGSEDDMQRMKGLSKNDRRSDSQNQAPFDNNIPQNNIPPNAPNMNGSNNSFNQDAPPPDASNRQNAPTKNDQNMPPDGLNNANRGMAPNAGGNFAQNNRMPNGGENLRGRGGGGGGNDIGQASWLRLWNQQLYGQGSWILLFAIAASIVLLIGKGWKQKDPKKASVLYWALWLVTLGLFFSFAGFFHSYYLCMMAPPTAALFAIGMMTLYKRLSMRSEIKLKDKKIRLGINFGNIILIVASVFTISIAAKTVWTYQSISGWMLPLMIGIGTVGLLLTLVAWIIPKKVWAGLCVGLLSIAMLIPSVYWAYTPMTYLSTNFTLPTAGPSENGGRSGPKGMVFSDMDNTGAVTMESYLLENYVDNSFLLTANRADDVAQLIVNTGLPCYAYGGFLGTDNSLDLERLQQLVAAGQIRYFLLSDRGAMGGGGKSSEIEDYVRENATLIDSSEYGGGNGQLYLFTD